LALVQARHGKDMPSMLSFITGPSRTGDIERILVLGAHGPKELYLVLVG
jgi:L-lactate dehydrogenase complex protein LldG